MFYAGWFCASLAVLYLLSEFVYLGQGHKDAADRANKDWLLLLIAALICFK